MKIRVIKKDNSIEKFNINKVWKVLDRVFKEAEFDMIPPRFYDYLEQLLMFDKTIHTSIIRQYITDALYDFDYKEVAKIYNNED